MITVAVFVVMLSLCLVSEARPLVEDSATNNNGIGMSGYGSLYHNAKYRMGLWFQQLSGGPSDGGAGH